jgi:hypothetical protein
MLRHTARDDIGRVCGRERHRFECAARLEMLVASADMWAFQLRIEAHVLGRPVLSRCQVRVNAVAFPASIDPRLAIIRGDVTLSSGDNRTQVYCQ